MHALQQEEKKTKNNYIDISISTAYIPVQWFAVAFPEPQDHKNGVVAL